MPLRQAALALALSALSACADAPPSDRPAHDRTRVAAEPVDEAAWLRLTDGEAAESVQDLLVVPPLVGRAQPDGATLHLVAGDEPLAVSVYLDGASTPRARALLDAGAAHEFVLRDLQPGRHAFEVRSRAGPRVQRSPGAFSTRAPPGEAFTVAVLADTHLPVPPPAWLRPGARRHPTAARDFDRAHARVGGVFRQVSAAIAAAEPDLVVHLGDFMDGRSFGDNPPFPTRAVARHAYLDVRRHLGAAGSRAAFHAVIGNWDGENGWHPPRLFEHGLTTRLELLPNPGPDTYAEGGGPNEDYYALTWGDALLVVLNVMSYTPLPHTLHPADQGTGEDWTLGAEQLAWFERTLQASDAVHRLVFIHHPVAGRGGDAQQSRYGRGGGRAAHVGEQARVHELMVEHGARLLLYGHDHVFTDMTVDGVHYTLPGNAGAPWTFGRDITGYETWDERSGYALLHVSPDAVRVDWHDVAGERFGGYVIEAP